MPPRVRRDERGTAAVEFALVLPLLLVITLALVQVGLLVRDRLLVESAVRAGARTAALQADPGVIQDAVAGAAPSLASAALGVSVSRAGAQGDPVTVTLTYTSSIDVPLVGWLFRSEVAMQATATDRQEFA